MSNNRSATSKRAATQAPSSPGFAEKPGLAEKSGFAEKARRQSLSALTGRDRGFWASRNYSFQAALAGAIHTLRTQPNAWIEMGAGVIIAIFGWLFAISALEWGLLGMTIFGILALEAVNTAVEAVVDLVSPEFHPLAKIAKDAAAGAMIFGVLGSLCIALGIFGPRILNWLQ